MQTDPCRLPWKKILGGNVLALAVVSLLADVSSEMVYPLLPVFLASLAPASAAAAVGVMDGLAEATASLLKVYAGRHSDRAGRRKPLVLLGYGLSGAVRPAVALAGAGWQVVALRVADRVGKGLRTAPRDALLGQAVAEDVRGRAFSFHRLMDHAGAVTGPVVAAGLLALLSAGPWFAGGAGQVDGGVSLGALRVVFAFSLVPAAAAWWVVWKKVRETKGSLQLHCVQDRRRHVVLPPRFFAFLAAVGCFALGNSSDLFFVLFAHQRLAMGAGGVLVLWVVLHLAKIAASMPGGWVADRLGARAAILVGWLLYALVYGAVPAVGAPAAMIGLLVVYGVYYGMTEGAERALVSAMVPESRCGGAFGWYHGVVGLAALPASLLFGLCWTSLGPEVAFRIGAGLAAVAAVLLALVPSGRRRPPGQAG